VSASSVPVRSATRSRQALVLERPRYGERIVVVILFTCAALSVAVTVGIILALLFPSLDFFRTVDPLRFFTGTEWSPLFSDPQFGVLPLLTATLTITVIATAVSLPLGLFAAVYLSEYASVRRRKLLKPSLEVLAGIPTVVYGFFALTFVTPWLQGLWPLGNPPKVFNGLSAGLVMGVMIVPTVASIAEDAMAAVPQSLRQGAAALGSTRFHISTRVVIPAALSGIVAAFVLGVSRAVGETMIVLIAAGGTPILSVNPLRGMQTMTAFIGAAGIGDQPTGSIGYKTIFAVGLTLFAMTLIMNLISIRLARRYRQVYE
jgi:phosphate transport system permease protein